MNEETLRVEIAQLHHERFKPEINTETIIERIEKSTASLVVFPEMFLTGYTLGSDMVRFVQDDDSPHLSAIRDSAVDNDRFVVFGFPAKSKEIRGQIHNTAGVFGPGGSVGRYDKLHLVDFGPFEEYAYFTPGASTFSFEVSGFRIGLSICYDIFFPELTKTYALEGADCVICISASPSITRKFFEAVMKARAVENTVYFIYSNLVGFDSRMDFWGGGAVIDPIGKEIVKGPYFEEEILEAEISAERIEQARRSRPTLRDTRVDVVEGMLQSRK